MDNAARMDTKVQELITCFVPNKTPQNVIQSYHSYCLRILTSLIANKSPDDENIIRLHVQKSFQRIAERHNIDKQTFNEKTIRLQQLLQALAGKKVPKKRLSVCYLLCKISENTDTQIDNISPLEAIIQAKQFEKSRIENNALLNNTQMEIEPNHLPGKRTMQAKMETKSEIAKIISKAANKGNPAIDISENDLLRDALFAFQGVDGNYIYYSNEQDSYIIKPKIHLSEPVKKMLLQLCEIGWLYRKVTNFVEKGSNESRGLVYQSLCYAIKQELDEYYRLLAMLENLRDADDDQSRSSYLVEENAAKKSLSLRKLYLWSLEPFEKLKWMSVFCDACQTAKGNSILSVIYSYSNQGSPSIQLLVNRILKQVLIPFSEFLRNWIYHGDLVDQYGEFFIISNPAIKDDNLWSDKYTLNRSLVPGFMDLQLAEKILITGKSVNFMKRCCDVNDWILDIEFNNISSSVSANTNQTLNFAEFSDWARKANEITSKVLLKIMFDKFGLIENFKTIRKFLLFRQGDFIQYLMDVLVPELSKPAITLYKHHLVPLLEGAIRASNAKYVNADLLSKLDVKLLNASPKDNGWDVFSLTYRVDPPLTTILYPKVMTGYLRIFNFLWRVKRIEHSLNTVWLNHMKQRSLMNRMKAFKVHLHKCNLLRNEMYHFIENLLNYLTIEAIESSWRIFLDHLASAKDLDEVIKYHDEFVNSMLEKALLTPRSEKIYRQVIKIFDLIFRFTSTQEILISSVQEEDQRKVAEKNKAQRMEVLEEGNPYEAKSESFIVEGFERSSAGQAMRIETLNSLKGVWKDYKDAFIELMELLKQDNLDGKLRFLSFRLDFNEYYDSITPKTSAIKDQKIEDFQFAKGPSLLERLDLRLNPNHPWNTRQRPISPPKHNQNEDKMLTEDLEEEHKDRILPSNILSTLKKASPPEELQKPTGLRTIDLEPGPTYSSENSSYISKKLDNLSFLIQSRIKPGMRPSMQNETQSNIEGSSLKLDDLAKQPYLKSINFGDPPSQKNK